MSAHDRKEADFYMTAHGADLRTAVMLFLHHFSAGLTPDRIKGSSQSVQRSRSFRGRLLPDHLFKKSPEVEIVLQRDITDLFAPYKKPRLRKGGVLLYGSQEAPADESPVPVLFRGRRNYS